MPYLGRKIAMESAAASGNEKMPSVSNWKVPSAVQPKPGDYGYDLERALSCVVGLHATVPSDAFTAETLGTERAGNGVFIRGNGLVLTIGYLITEADTIWITLTDGRSVPGHVLGYDQESGFGLVQALAKLDAPSLEIGNSAAASIGERVVIGGFGGRHRLVIWIVRVVPIVLQVIAIVFQIVPVVLQILRVPPSLRVLRILQFRQVLSRILPLVRLFHFFQLCQLLQVRLRFRFVAAVAVDRFGLDVFLANNLGDRAKRPHVIMKI